MAAPIPAHIYDDAFRCYLAGKPMPEVLASAGISATGFHRERNRRGIPPRSFKQVPISELIEAYESGESILAISDRTGVSRLTITDRLRNAGVELRGRSAAGKVRAAKMSPEERAQQAAAAHEAVRGVSQPYGRLVKMAETRARSGLFQSEGEQFLFEQLEIRGIAATPQLAIGKYNVDLAVAPVAVEVLGGGWHGVRRSHATRTPEILDAGWHLVLVWDYEGTSAISAGAAGYLVAFIDEMRRNPPSSRQYRVIAGNGQLLAARRREDDEFPLVPPPRSSNGGRA